jgi:hypothetical protein
VDPTSSRNWRKVVEPGKIYRHIERLLDVSSSPEGVLGARDSGTVRATSQARGGSGLAGDATSSPRYVLLPPFSPPLGRHVPVLFHYDAGKETRRKLAVPETEGLGNLQ